MGKSIYKLVFIFFSIIFSFYIFKSLFYFLSVSLTGFSINYNFFSNLLVPSIITSISFSIISVFMIVLIISKIRKEGIEKIFRFKGFLLSLIILITIFLINYYITLFPYGTFFLSIISFFLQVLIYGIILPYVIFAQLVYVYLIVSGKINEIK